MGAKMKNFLPEDLIQELWDLGLKGTVIYVPKYYPVTKNHKIPFGLWLKLRNLGIVGPLRVPKHIRKPFRGGHVTKRKAL